MRMVERGRSRWKECDKPAVTKESVYLGKELLIIGLFD